MQQTKNQIVILRGQRIYSSLYNRGEGTVFAVHGEQNPAGCGSLGGVVSFGGQATFDIVFDDGSMSPQLPETILRGVQWEILAGEMASEEEIAAALANAALTEAKNKADKQAAAEAFAKATEAIKAEFPWLKTLQPGESAFKLAIANIRILLKREFPGVKFSVRQRSHDCIDISWTDGPTQCEVDRWTERFKGGHFNGMEDIYEFSASPWTAAFGDSKYVFTSREFSPAVLQRAIDTLWEVLPLNLAGVEKPTPDTVWQGYAQVPDLGFAIRDAVASLRAAWNATRGLYVMPDRHYGCSAYPVKLAVERQEETASS